MTYGAETRVLTTQAKNKLAAEQTKMDRSMVNITYRDRKTNTWVREKTEVDLGMAHQQDTRKPMDHLETLRKEKT